jgi:23S rRNA (uracil1939-C5)-methyltransferase
MDTVDIKIDNLVYGGEGVGRLPDGRAVFVPFTLPGELVRIWLREEKPHFARAELVKLLEPSPRRIVARCSHFGYCGGCHYQHMHVADQLEAKTAILHQQLERIGGLKEIPSIEAIAAPEPWYYRNVMQFHLTREGKLGFQRAHSNQTFAIRECHLPEEPINSLWPQLDIEPLPGLERLILRSGADDELMLILECSVPQPLDFDIEGVPISIVQHSPAGRLVLAGSDHILMEVSGRRFRVSSSSFFQVNTHQARAIVEHLLAQIPLDETMTVLDVYCGVGLFSAFLAPKVTRLVGIEISPDSCDDFTTNLDEFENVSLYEAPAETVLNDIQFNPDVIVVDPPREGLAAKTVAGILAQEASYLAYISCDPATLARDARRLISGGFRLSKVTLFDLFPHTYHLESMTIWEKA